MGFLLLNAATELHQLFRLPALWSHYLHHKQEDPGMSLLAFLHLHYSVATHPQDGDEQEDGALPFRSVGTLQHIDLNWTPVGMEESALPPVPSPVFVVFPERLTSRFPSGVFHPPQATA